MVHDKISAMMATVSYEGIAIVKGAPAREDGAGVFVDCEFPMPVGTRLDVQIDHGGARPARVVRVQEAQQGGGMVLAWAGEASEAPAVNAPSAPQPAEGSGGHGRRKKRR
jgi:hypothetical protein